MKSCFTSGLQGNELSKIITGTSDVFVERTAISIGAGTALGAASAPITIPAVVISGGIAFIASLF